MKYCTTLLSLAFSICLLFMPSCRAPKELEYRDFKNLKLEKMGFASTALKVDLVYYNPNNFSLQLKYTDLDIFINNVYLGHSNQDYQITIPRLGEFSLPISIDVAMENLLKNAFITLLGSEVQVRITGKVKIGKANVYKTFPVAYEGMHKLPLF